MMLVMTMAAKDGPKVCRTYMNVKSPRKMPHSESTYRINMIHENAYAMRKKKNRGCCCITAWRRMEKDVD